VGPGTGLDRCGKSLPAGIRSPDLPARSVFAIPTELSRLHTCIYKRLTIDEPSGLKHVEDVKKLKIKILI
jgi:hypothetical protein